MKIEWILFPAALAVVLSASSCEKKEDEKKDSGGGSSNGQSNVYMTLKLKSTAATLAPDLAAETCGHVQASQSGPAIDGKCLTPDNVTVWASTVSIFKINSGSEGTGARLLGGGTGLGKNGYLEGALFNLSQAGTLKGEDTLWEVKATKPEFDSIGLAMAYLRIAFKTNTQEWEALLPFVDQPVEDIQAIKDCVDAPALANIKTNANVITGLSYKKGDYLFCKKTTGSSCSFSDFKWFDTTTKTLTSTRPSAPKRFSYADNYEVKCKTPGTDSTPPDMDFYTHAMFFSLSSKIKIHGDFSHGSDSEINKGADKPYGISQADWDAHTQAGGSSNPFFIYTLDSNGTKTTGNRMDVKLSFDMTDWIVIDGVYDFTSATDAQILSGFNTKDLFMRDSLKKGEEYSPIQKVTAEISVSDSKLAEIYATPAPGATPTTSN